VSHIFKLIHSPYFAEQNAFESISLYRSGHTESHSKIVFEAEVTQPPYDRYHLHRTHIDQNEIKTLETGEADVAFVPTPRLLGRGATSSCKFDLNPAIHTLV
jgi:hypothetical protein